MQQLDQQRQHYLEAMGITTWLPTEVLPGAARSPQWSWDGVSLDEQVEEAQVTDTQAVESAPSVLAEIRSKVDQTETSDSQSAALAPASPAEPALKTVHQESAPQQEVATKSASESDIASKPQEQQPPPRFRMAMVAYKDCLVIAQLPMDVLQALAPEHQRLITRILNSVGLGQSEGNVQLFAWPIVNNPNVDQSLPLAQAAIAQLEKRFEASELPLVVFGERMVEYLGLPSVLTEQPQSVGSRPAIQGPTLNELMSVPGLKRELWEQLQAFKKLL